MSQKRTDVYRNKEVSFGHSIFLRNVKLDFCDLINASTNLHDSNIILSEYRQNRAVCSGVTNEAEEQVLLGAAGDGGGRKTDRKICFNEYGSFMKEPIAYRN